MKTQTLKGFRDFLPEEARKREYVVNTLKAVFVSYGFEPLETPALEYEEVLLGKYGQEGDKLMYRFTDRGGRKVALRYDQTVPLARVIAQYPQAGSEQFITLPFKRYQIQPVWRADKPQKGRYREFLQCDIDTVGSTSLLADAEIVACTLEAARKLGFKNLIMQINDRELFAGVETKYLVTLDKLNKVGKERVIEELSLRGMSQKEAVGFVDKFKSTQPTEIVKKIFSYLVFMGFEEGKDFAFNPLLVRGLDYYTGAIFELTDPKDPSASLAGGGRYDKLIGIFSKGDSATRQVPATGISFGFDRIVEAMTLLSLFPQSAVCPTAKVLVTVFKRELAPESLKIASALREKGIATEVYPDTDTNLDKQLKYANKRGIPWVILLGGEEARSNTITLKNMETGMQEKLSLDKIAKKLLCNTLSASAPDTHSFFHKLPKKSIIETNESKNPPKMVSRGKSNLCLR